MQKLNKVLKVRQLAERESAQSLARSRAARAEAESAQQQLHDLKAQYRSHGRRSSRCASTVTAQAAGRSFCWLGPSWKTAS